MADFKMKVRVSDEEEKLKLGYEQDASIKARYQDVIKTGEILPEFAGPYTVTPTRETQVLPTNGKKMAGSVTVEPIPPNYGLITWNGRVLTVS